MLMMYVQYQLCCTVELCCEREVDAVKKDHIFDFLVNTDQCLDTDP